MIIETHVQVVAASHDGFVFVHHYSKRIHIHLVFEYREFGTQAVYLVFGLFVEHQNVGDFSKGFAVHQHQVVAPYGGGSPQGGFF